MKDLFLLVRANGDYMKKDAFEYKIEKDCNGFYRLYVRARDGDHSDHPHDGWENTYVSSC